MIEVLYSQYSQLLRQAKTLAICSPQILRETEIDALVGKKADARNDQDAIRDALYVHLERTLCDV